jgi:hypothetical protein
MPRRNLEDLLLALDSIRTDNVAEHVPLIRDGMNDLIRRFLALEATGIGNNHRPPRRSATKEQKS